MKPSGNPRYQILVVDDEPTVCKAIKLLLKFDGHEVQTADSGEAALDLLEERQFDLIITDYSMLGIKGDELAATIKERRPGQPIIMATAFFDNSYIPGQPVARVDCILTKPFSQTELREAIVKVMSLKKSQPIAPAQTAVSPDTLVMPSPDGFPPPPRTDSSPDRAQA